jgi:hypothetical protein
MYGFLVKKILMTRAEITFPTLWLMKKKTEKSNVETFLNTVTDQAPADPEIIFMDL